MIKWAPYAFVRVSIFFIGGIAFAILYKVILPVALVSVCLAILITLYFLIAVLTRQRKTALNPGALGLIAIFLLGYAHLHWKTDSRKENHFMHTNDSISYYKVVINRFTESKRKSWKVEAKVVSIYTTEWRDNTGKILLYFSKDDFQSPFVYGDILIVRGGPSLVMPPLNPGEFDYQKYLSYRNIYHQHFLRTDEVKHIGNDTPSIILKYAFTARTWAEKTMKKYVRGDREQGIASALVLGVTDGLDHEILSAYSATGAMHVLSVSGLHVSIIYMILLILLKPLRKFKGGEWWIAFISLFALWSYAFITGLSPSVLRAVTMFAFMAIARPMGKSTNIYNTLAASAFCILLFDPYLIMSVGFQLSYLAVIGILYFQSDIYNLWEPKTRLMDEIWKISSVSIAAQIATLSLGLLYFHQFPNYFLVANLLVIPGSFAVLVLGILVLCMSFFGLLANALGFLLTWSIKALNFVVLIIEDFPLSIIDNINISLLQCWLLIGLIVAITLLFRKKKFAYAPIAFFLCICFSADEWYREVLTSGVIVYNVKGHQAIDLIDRGRLVFVADSALLADKEKIRFHIRPYRLNAGIKRVEPENMNVSYEINGGKIIKWEDVIVLNIIGTECEIPDNMFFDYIIISNESVSNLVNLTSHFKEKIILDSSNSYFYSKRLKEDALALNVAVHAVILDSAFECRFPKSN